MAGDELGSVILGVRVDASDATKGLAEVGEALDNVASEAGDFDKAASKAFDKTSVAAKSLGDEVTKGAGQAGDAMAAFANDAKQAASKVAQGADKMVDGFEGLDDLKDKTGELDSSLKGLGGAIGLVSPEAERLLFVVGEMSGGLEASSRLATLAGMSHRALLLTLGPLTLAVGAAVAAYAIYNHSLAEAEAAEKLLNEAREEGAALLVRSQDNIRAATVLIGGLTSLEAQREATEQRHALANAARNEEFLRGRRDRTEAETQSMLISHRSARQLEASELALLTAREQNVAATEAQRRAATAAAQAASVLAVNRQADLEILRASDPALATYLQRSEAITAQVEAGLTPERAHLLNLQNEIDLEAARAEALETTAEAVEALDPKIAALATQSKAAAEAANIHAEATQKGDDALAASSIAMSGFFDLASQMSGKNANQLKELAIAETTINGLAAGIKAFAELGPVAGGIAAAGIAASTAAALMQIEGQAIPTMHSGGMVGGGVGDTMINAQSGEAILNRQAVANIGGPRAVEDLNNSQGASGGGGVVVNLSYRQRAFDSVVIDNLAKGGPLRSALNRASNRGRRRVGGVL